MGSTVVSPIEYNIPRWTAEAALRLLPETLWPRHEVIDGSLILMPNPGIAHQRTSSRLWQLLDASAPDTVEVAQALNIVLPGEQLTIPDVVVLRSSGADQTWFTADEVLLVAEVVSPGNAPMDRKVKPDLYAEAGIPYFLRIELAVLRASELFELRDGRYVSIATGGPDQPLTATEPFPFTVDPPELQRST
jgi:Uma2 family endonuclease